MIEPHSDRIMSFFLPINGWQRKQTNTSFRTGNTELLSKTECATCNKNVNHNLKNCKTKTKTKHWSSSVKSVTDFRKCLFYYFKNEKKIRMRKLVIIKKAVYIFNISWSKINTFSLLRYPDPNGQCWASAYKDLYFVVSIGQ